MPFDLCDTIQTCDRVCAHRELNMITIKLYAFVAQVAVLILAETVFTFADVIYLRTVIGLLQNDQQNAKS